MDSKSKLTLAWTVAGILAVLLAITLFMLMNQPKTLGDVLQDGKEDVTAQRDRVAEACDGNSPSACDRELEALANILKDFSKDITKATSTMKATVGTTTAQ